MWVSIFYVNYLYYFQHWNLDKDLNFPNSTIDSKLGLVLGCTSRFFLINQKILWFLNVALAGLLDFSQFMKEIKN